MDRINKIWPKWQPVEVIGKGGFGTVYKAKRENFGEVSYSAIKVVKIPSDDSDIKEMSTSGLTKDDIKEYYKKSVMSLLSEIKLMEKMKSASHIVGIEDYEVVEEDMGWKVYIRMELLTNVTDYFTDKQIQVSDVIKLSSDILTALEFCHAQNLVHRDIKPANIFVSEFGEFKLGDFGISREVEKTNATLSQKGTKSYMAPEMVRMEKYGKNVDLYALGLTMYELLNHGRMPFLPSYPERFYPADREDAMIKRLTGEVFPEINGIGHLNQIIQKACHFDPKCRYQSATEMKNDLLNGAPLSDNVISSTTTIANDETTMNGFQTSLFDNKTTNANEKPLFTSNDEKTMISSNEETVGIFSNSFLFEDKTKKEPKAKIIDFVFEDTKTITKPRVNLSKLQSLTSTCPSCNKKSYLVAPNVYMCGDCYSIVEESKDPTTSQLANLFLKLSNSVGKPNIQLDCAKKMYELAPNSAQVCLRVGLYYGKMGNDKEKLKYYLRALELDPRDALIYNNLGVYYLEVDNKKALEYMEKANQSLKDGNISLGGQEGTIHANYASALELSGSNSVLAFNHLQSAYRADYEDCTKIVDLYGVGERFCKEKILKVLNEHRSEMPKCLVTDKTTLNSLKSLFCVADKDEVLFALQPKILFGGKKQGMVFTKRAIYYFDRGEATKISYYRLGHVYFKSKQGHILFNIKNNKYTYDVQLGQDASSFMTLISLIRKSLYIIHRDDILMNIKK